VRTNPHLGLHDVEIEVEVETRGPNHRDTLLKTLADGNYHVEVG